LERLDKNPMRIIDCKSPVCQEIAKDAPHMADNLCEECSTEFEKLKAYLSGANIAFEVDKTIVRGLDYYTRTVFEITSDALGAQSTVCGGGRYNGLVEELGGKPTEGIGFAIGVERLLMIMKSQGLDLNIKTENPPEIFIVSLDEKSDMLVQNLVHDLRQSGIHAERDLCDRSVKAQMKFANKLGAKFSMVIGDDEITSNIGKLKNMDSGDTIETALTCADIMKNL
ncbi:MAG: ATP phosphoribosyltransferase regulatory subunit, partial [Oscillospiraceae bacterium]